MLNKAVNCVPIVTNNQPPFRTSSILRSSALRYRNRIVNVDSVIPAQRTIAAYQRIDATVYQQNNLDAQIPARLTIPTSEKE
ncbi:hypothetical protein SCALIN_C24_0043 [Candidatus Scalindua japonica]|uniref:Uncharacterized protein n=1 Tax=Candidatus Scalindua japonica TaxID=1284222 RepID=A0A286U098_9BACT|nr:hypothetical protein SCALIN_C24_0043 [Candidatus Scalindua japonica]